MIFNIYRQFNITPFIYYQNVRYLHKNYYQILNIARDSSTKDIKAAYIKLTKQHHPDKSTQANAHTKFLEITEAYNILSKPALRRNYDLSCPEEHSFPRRRPYRPYPGMDPMKDPFFWKNRDRSRDKFYTGRPYYGVKGVQRLPNIVIVMICIFVTTVGVALQVAAIMKSVTFRRKELTALSDKAKADLEDTKRRAEINGNLAQLEILRQKLEAERQLLDNPANN